MKKLITLFLLMIIINANIKSQSKAIRIGGDCMLENSVILSEVLFALDSLFIQDMYDENCKLLLFASIDSEGNLINIDTNLTLKRSNVIFRDSLLQRMEEYIKSNNIKFYQCYLAEPGLTLDKIRVRNTARINIAIPSSSHKRLLHYMKYREMIRESYDYFSKYK